MSEKNMKPIRVLNIVSKAVCLASLVTFGIGMTGGDIALDNEAMVNQMLGQSSSILVKDPNAANKDLEYYKSQFTSVKDVRGSAKRFAETIESEGATLLKNSKKDGTPALPLASGSKVNMYSASTAKPIASGSGSGGVSGDMPTLVQGLKAAGLKPNENLFKWYNDNLSTYGRRNIIGTGNVGTICDINEARWDEIKTPARDDAAEAGVFLLSRTGGEGHDNVINSDGENKDTINGNIKNDYKNGNYLILNDDERDVIKNMIKLREEGKLKSVIVILNSANQVQLDFLEELDIDAVLWAGTYGEMGAYAIGDILAGNVNPSGKLPDTFWKKHYLNPVHANFSRTSAPENEQINQGFNTRPQGLKEEDIATKHSHYVVYQEGIYMGYRYTETRYEDKVLGRANTGDFDYNNVVSYPFGFGMSYSQYEYSNFKVTREQANTANGYRDSKYIAEVTVKNTGKVPGKESVQLYLQKPYTSYDIENGIEKAAVELVDFNKTKVLQPGESQTLKLEVEENAFASYDSQGKKTYIVDAGDYYLTVGKNAHDAVNNILAAKGKTTSDGMTENGNKKLTYKTVNNEFNDTRYSKSVATGAEIKNQFDDVDLNMAYNDTNHVDYVSRNNWAGTVKFGLDDNNNRTFNNVQLNYTNKMWEDHKFAQRRLNDDFKGGEYPIMGSTATKYTLAMMRIDDGDGDPTNDKVVDYNDPMWDKLLDQLTIQEYVQILTRSGYGSEAIESVGKPYVIDHDGGNGVSQPYNINQKNNRGLAVRLNDPDRGLVTPAYPSNAIAAATYNKELAKEYGKQWGEDCLWSGIAGLYGMGLNTHRSPFSGRNFEYYSEDPTLAGLTSAQMIEGMHQRGAYTYLKHIGLNDQEAYRCGILTWANEQTIREIYMKPFQIAVEKGGAKCLMASLNSMGVTYSGAQGFLETVVRDEWGMTGHVVSDTSNQQHGDYGLAYSRGLDLPLGGIPVEWFNDYAPKGTYNEWQKKEVGTGEYGAYWCKLRENVHRILYTVTDSFYMNGISSGDKIVSITPAWKNTLKGVRIASGIILVLSIAGICATTVINRKEYFEEEE